MFYTVYRTTNLTNGKVYVGKHKTNDLDDRYLGSGKLLRRAIEKHGRENFRKEILHVLETEEEMDLKEAELVTEEFCLRDDNYNLCVGGRGGWSLVNREGLNDSELRRLASAEASRKYRDKNSEGLKRYWASERSKSRNFTAPSFSGFKHTDDAKKRIGSANSKKQRGSKNSQFGTMWITDGIHNSKIKSLDNIPNGWYKGRRKCVSDVGGPCIPV